MPYPSGGFCSHPPPVSNRTYLSALSGIRTHTGQLLELLPLPIGLQEHDADFEGIGKPYFAYAKYHSVIERPLAAGRFDGV